MFEYFLHLPRSLNVYVSELQRKEVKKYALIDSLKMKCEKCSVSNVNSSSVRVKKKRIEEQSLSQINHLTFMDRYEEMGAKKSITHTGISKGKKCKLHLNTKIKLKLFRAIVLSLLLFESST